jgi:putative membrane protein insertion efficiency factor
MKRVLQSLVRAYRLLFSPWVGAGCRFYPTCSGYALEALERHGAAAGSYLAARRILRCHPWCDGGADAVPLDRPRIFSRLLASRRHGGSSFNSTNESSP